MKRMILGLAILSGVALSIRACSRTAPDTRLRNHFRGICEVAENGISDPKKGVDRLFSYMGKHGPEMLRDFGDLLVEIERIENDAAHDERARQARQAMMHPLVACIDDIEHFADAIENDPAARAAFQRGMDRFGRTLSILFEGSDQLRNLTRRITSH